MKRSSWFIITIIAILVLFFGALQFNLTGQVVSEENISSIDGELIEEKPELAKPEEITITHEINILNYAFIPDSLEINIGDKVVWTNKDETKHTITSKEGTELNSRFLGKGERYIHTFKKPGTYNYFCKPHPYMQGKIIVS